MIASLQLEVRSDISVLAASHSDLAKEFQELRDQIDSPAGTFGSSMFEDSSTIFNSNSISNQSKLISERHALFKQFDDLLRYIRTLQGFENFLQGPSEDELRSLGEGGAIVVFNVSDIRSDAFLITTDEIRSVHLPSLISDIVEELAKYFSDAINKHNANRYRHAKRKMDSILEGLWERAVKSILDEPGFNQMPSSDDAWPRVWWIGSGLLSILPIHASGIRSPLKQRLIVLSHHMHPVKSLAYARERATKADQMISNKKAMLIAMPTTLEQESLQIVETEANDLENIFSYASIDTKVMKNPTRAETLTELPQYTIVHFACHGYSADNPSQSSLREEDW